MTTELIFTADEGLLPCEILKTEGKTNPPLWKKFKTTTGYVAWAKRIMGHYIESTRKCKNSFQHARSA